MTRINWPMLNLPPINLPVIGIAPVRHKCTHWAVYNSRGYRQCIDCGYVEYIEPVSPKHQR